MPQNKCKKTVFYIANKLESPETAMKWSEYLRNEIETLQILPSRYKCVDIEPWKSNGIRKMPVKNFLIYYMIDENSTTVWITSIIYAKRNQLNQLKEMPLK